MIINNPKIGYRSFPGFSLLFDPPDIEANTLAMDEDLRKLVCSPEHPQLGLFRNLRETLEGIGLDRLAGDYGFLDLPFYSYHVTAWDGLNRWNQNEVEEEHREILERTLLKIPYGLDNDHPLLKLPRKSLLMRGEWPIGFKFRQLAILRGSVMIALLEAADEDSQELLDRLAEHRLLLYRHYRAQTGLQQWIDCMPHVTLGYFANETGGRSACEALSVWQQTFNEKLAGETLTFNDISLYGFTDMENFYRVE